jgi:drug/metabolite transporter (DMT)-like permease
MTWLFFAIISYFINAVTAIIDKFLLNKSVPSPVAYTFYVGFLSFFAVILIPFGVVWPGISLAVQNMIPGIIFFWAVFLFITAVKKYEVSRVVTMIGGFTPVFSLILSFFIFHERLGGFQLLAFILLVAGSVLISFKRNGIDSVQKKSSFLGVGVSIAAAFTFALYYVSAKIIFSGEQPFISAFFWSRMGSFLAAVLILAVPSWRILIFCARKTAGVKGGVLFVTNKVLAALGFILLNYSIKLGNVSLINAIQGVQYVFLFGLVIYLAKKYPKVLEEKITGKIIAQKILAVILIGCGLALIYF